MCDPQASSRLVGLGPSWAVAPQNLVILGFDINGLVMLYVEPAFRNMLYITLTKLTSGRRTWQFYVGYNVVKN